MSKILSFALGAFFVVYIVKGVKGIVEKIKAKRAQKGEQKETECDTTESKEE